MILTRVCWIRQEIGLEVIEGHGDGSAVSPKQRLKNISLSSRHLRGIGDLPDISHHSVIMIVTPEKTISELSIKGKRSCSGDLRVVEFQAIAEGVE